MIRSMSLLTSKLHQKVSQPSLYLHNKNASFDSSVVKLAPKVVLTYPILDNLFGSFSIMNRWVSIDGRDISIELRAELSFLLLFMKASNKMKCRETELCFQKKISLFHHRTSKYITSF